MSNARGLSWFVRDPPDLSVRPFGGSAPPAQFAIEGDVTVYWDAGCPTVGLPPGARRPELLEAMKGHVLADAQYMGRFERK